MVSKNQFVIWVTLLVWAVLPTIGITEQKLNVCNEFRTVTGPCNTMPNYLGYTLKLDEGQWGKQGPFVKIEGCGFSPAQGIPFFETDSIADWLWHSCESKNGPQWWYLNNGDHIEVDPYYPIIEYNLYFDYDKDIFTVSGGCGSSGEVKVGLTSNSCDIIKRAEGKTVEIYVEVYRAVDTFEWCCKGDLATCLDWCGACNCPGTNGQGPRYKGELIDNIYLATVGVKSVGENPCY